MGNRYYVIIIHKHGGFPEIVRDRHSLPLMFDTREEAQAKADKASGRDSWKTTVVELED